MLFFSLSSSFSSAAAASSCFFSSPSAKTLLSSSSSTSLRHFHRNPRPSKFITAIRCCSSSSTVTNESESVTFDQSHEHLVSTGGNYAGICLEETVAVDTKKSRIDSWISLRLGGVSRARVQSSIRSGLVSVNGRTIDKVSQTVRGGDKVNCTISELQPLRAEPEDIPIHIVYEDAHVLVVNKPPHMVVHPAPGNPNGTLVNGILHHCSLPTIASPDSEMFSETEDMFDDDLEAFTSDQSSSEETSSSSSGTSVRPGIVHRLDKGTSGLLVVAKDEHSHTQLCEQFKLHTINRVYMSLTSGVPSPNSGRIEVPVGRDVNNRIRMTALPGCKNTRLARYAASRYKVIEVLAGGGSALVEWRLETGRTHQIRAHAKHLGIPLLGDEVYGGTKGMALSLLKPKTPSNCYSLLTKSISKLERPCLHAFVLGFKHPHTGEYMQFQCPPPADFAEILSSLRSIQKELLQPTVKK